MKVSEELEDLMHRALAEALAWKGRALAATPAMRVALNAIENLDYLQCPWCGEMITHTPDCVRDVAIKVLKEALGGGEIENAFKPQGHAVFEDLTKQLWAGASIPQKIATVFLLLSGGVLVSILVFILGVTLFKFAMRS